MYTGWTRSYIARVWRRIGHSSLCMRIGGRELLSAGESIRIRRPAQERTNLQDRFLEICRLPPHRNLTFLLWYVHACMIPLGWVACRGCTVEYVLYIQYMYSCVLISLFKSIWVEREAKPHTYKAEPKYIAPYSISLVESIYCPVSQKPEVASNRSSWAMFRAERRLNWAVTPNRFVVQMKTCVSTLEAEYRHEALCWLPKSIWRRCALHDLSSDHEASTPEFRSAIPTWASSNSHTPAKAGRF